MQNQNKIETLILKFLSQVDAIYYKSTHSTSEILHDYDQHELKLHVKNNKIFNKIYVRKNQIEFNYNNYKILIACKFENDKTGATFDIGTFVDKNDNVGITCVNVDIDPSDEFKTQLLQCVEKFKQMLIDDVASQI